MNTDKIKNYNQKLLAVLGTIVLLIAIIGLIFISIFTVTEISRSFRNNNQDSGILSNEKIEELQRKNKRKQIISYETPRLVDTLNLVYIIPVSHKTLNSPEFIDEGLMDLMNYSGSNKVDKRYSKQYYGDFNNLLIYDFKNEKVEKLFNERVNFGIIQIEYFNDDILLLINAATKDTYKDGVINLIDYKTLFLYSLKTKSLKEISIENADVYQFNFVENTKNLLINFGIDYNKDGKFEELAEPSIIKKYDYQSGVLKNIISEEISNDLQKKLEGSEK